MNKIYQEIIANFEGRVAELNRSRLGGVPCPPLEVIILGQQALLIQHEKLSGLTLLATTDFDATLRGEVPLEDIFKQCLEAHGIAYDEESELIWMPAETEYDELYRSSYVVVRVPLPVYLLLSKARYAREKNRQLIIDAIAGDQFDEQLLELMERYNVDIEYFLRDEDEV